VRRAKERVVEQEIKDQYLAEKAARAEQGKPNERMRGFRAATFVPIFD